MPDRAKPLLGTTPDDAFDVAVEHLSRDQRRSRRTREVRKTTIALRDLGPRALRAGALELLEVGVSREEYLNLERPRTRRDCEDSPRPCPFVGCRHHLYLDISRGGITLNFPDLEPGEMAETCSLDVAELGKQRLEDVGALMNVTRERIRQIEVRALEVLKARGRLREWNGHESEPKGGMP